MKQPTIVSPEVLKRQMLILLEAWGMPEDQARETATILQGADLMGIDSHGLALFPLYDEIRRSGKLVIAPAIKVVRNIGAIAVIDGGGGFGEAPAARAMKLAIEKARTFGIGAVTVRNSNHYGAAGIYALMAAEQDFIGISTTATFSTAIVPTFGKEPMLGTNPIAFAAPARRNPPFLLDMATSTVAVGKVKLALMAEKQLPDGWVTTKEGGWQSDPATAMIERLLTPLGGDRLHGGHKGYGLATMVEILSTTLSGGSFTPLRPDDAERYNVGHFQLAMNPDLFRDEGGFREDLDALLDSLRATPPIDPREPVKVAGDPEHATRREREQNGIPVPDVLATQILGLCKAANAEYLLE